MTRRLGWIWLAVFGLVGCGGDDSNGSGMRLTEVPDELEPGTTLEWNPKIEIVDGTRFTYENDDADSEFTASIESGTYTYAQENGVGVLVLSGTSAGDGKLLSDLPATIRLDAGDGGLEIRIGTMTFAATVVAPAPDGKGGAGSGGSNMEVPGTLPDGAEPATVHENLVGRYELTFGYAQAGAPFEAGDTATFEITASGALKAFGKTLSNPYTRNGNAAEIIWNDGELGWAVSDNQSGVFNEINVQNATSETWLGQWADASKFESPAEQGDIGTDVMFEITVIQESPMARAPYAQGTIVTVNWDGAEGLTIEVEGETITPSYVGEEEPPSGPRVYGEEDVVRILVFREGSEAEGHEYALKLEADDTIAVFEASYYKMGNTSKLYGRSSARHP